MVDQEIQRETDINTVFQRYHQEILQELLKAPAAQADPRLAPLRAYCSPTFFGVIQRFSQFCTVRCHWMLFCGFCTQ